MQRRQIVEERGYGFITPHGDGSDVFFHFSALADDLPFNSQLTAREVVFDVEMDPRKGRPRAANIRPAT